MRDKAWFESPLFSEGFRRDDTSVMLASDVEDALNLGLSVVIEFGLFEVELGDSVQPCALVLATMVVLAILEPL